jgi:hypothetical protein
MELSLNKEYCPECVEELKRQRKKLGYENISWLVCLKCGFRKKPETEYSKLVQRIEFEKRKIKADKEHEKYLE